MAEKISPQGYAIADIFTACRDIASLSEAIKLCFILRLPNGGIRKDALSRSLDEIETAIQSIREKAKGLSR